MGAVRCFLKAFDRKAVEVLGVEGEDDDQVPLSAAAHREMGPSQL